MADAVLVHGAWHGRWCWDRVISGLAYVGIEAIAPDLPFTGIADDIAAARAAVDASRARVLSATPTAGRSSAAPTRPGGSF